ncbi:MAG: DUF2442 domain-containing protein [Limisphaerales bacterium]
MFSKEFRKKLETKYSSWAKDLTEDHLEALFWAMGEYGYRASYPLEVLHRYATKDQSYARYMVGLETIAEFIGGRRTNLDSLIQRLHSARNAVCDEPPPVCSAFYHDGLIIVKLTTGMELRFPVSANPKLAAGTDEQLNEIEISLFAIHWPALNECLPFRSLLWVDFGQRTTDIDAFKPCSSLIHLLESLRL